MTETLRLFLNKLKTIALFCRIRLVAPAPSPVVLWALPAAVVLSHPDLPPPPPVCPLAFSPVPVQARAPRISRAYSVWTHTASHFLIISHKWQCSWFEMTHSGPTSKFRHIQGAVMHRNTHITNMRGLNLTTPGECDGFCINRERVAVPLAISGGQIAIFEVQMLLEICFQLLF